MSKIVYDNFDELKEKFTDIVTSDAVFGISFDLVFGFDNKTEVKICDGDNSDILIEGFISFMLSRDFKDSRFTKEIQMFIKELNGLYSCGINDCKPAFEIFVKALREDCKINGKAIVESVRELYTALLSVGLTEVSNVLYGEAEKSK